MVALVLEQRVAQVQALQELVWVLWGVLRLVVPELVWVHQAVVDFRVLEQWVAQFQADQALVSVWRGVLRRAVPELVWLHQAVVDQQVVVDHP